MDSKDLQERYFTARALYWRRDLQVLDAQAVAQLIKTLNAVQRDILKRILADAEELAKLSDWRTEHDIMLAAWCDDVLAGANAVVNDTIMASTALAGETSLLTYGAILSFDGAAKNIKLIGLSKAQVASFFEADTLGKGTIGQWVKKTFAEGIKLSVIDGLRKVVVEGKGTAAAVKSAMQAAVAEGMELTKRDAITLARTFIQTANIKAQEAVFDANKDIILGYKWLATLDNKVCLKCALADGTVYKHGEPRPELPCHPRCRCLWIPVCKGWADFGFKNVQEFNNAARPWAFREDGNIDEGGKRKIEAVGQFSGTFEDWWKQLSDEDKARTSIGKKRRELLESGKVKWSDLWDKATGRVYRLDELKI